MKQDLKRLQDERDEDHRALRTAVNLSGHLVLGSGGTGSASSSGAHEAKGDGKNQGSKGGKGGKGKPKGKGTGKDHKK